MEAILLAVSFLVWLGAMVEMEPMAPDTERPDMDLDISSTEGANDWVPKRKAA